MTSIPPASRNRPSDLNIHSDLTGLPVLKLGRKSSPDPKNPGKSIDDQFVDLDRQCERFGLVEFGRIEEDIQGASAYSKRMEREKFQQAMKIIESHPIAVFAVWELSRSARRLKIHGELMELLEERNCLIMVGGRLYDASDPNDRRSLAHNAVQDENQVMTTRHESKRGLREAAKQGKPHGPALYGYVRVYHQRTRALISVEKVEEEAAVIEQIVQWIKAGKSQRWIARQCTDRMNAGTAGYGRPRGGRMWYAMDVRDIATNIAYTGKRSHTIWDPRKQQPTEQTTIWDGMQPQIISPEDFDTCQSMLAATTNNAGWSKTAKWLLSGLLSCGDCGSPMWSTPHIERRPSRPASYGKTINKYACRAPHCRVSRDMVKVDTVVRDAVTEWINTPKILSRIVAESRKVNPKLRTMRIELAAAEKEVDEAYELLSAAGIARVEKRWLPKIDELRSSIASMDAEAGPNAWVDLAANRIDRVIPEDTNAARELLTQLIRVTILRAGRGQAFDPSKIVIRPLGSHD